MDNPIPMGISETRRQNLILLIAQTKGGRQAVAEKSDTKYNYFSQILMDPPAKNMGGMVARRIEEAFGLDEGWMDIPREREYMLQNSKNLLEDLQEKNNVVRESILDDIRVPEFSVTASMGPGNEFAVEDIVSSWPINEKVLIKMGVPPEQAAIVRVEGNSMSNTLNDGDLVLVDRTPIQRLSGKVYILWSERIGLQAKRVRLSTDGSQVEVISDNPDKDAYPTRSYDPEAFEETFKVRAQVSYVFMAKVRDL